MKRKSHLVIGIYFHPEAYPPTLNAIGELSDCFGEISVVHRPHFMGSWNYPANVKAIPSGRLISSSEQEKAPLHQKILFFLQFTVSLLRACYKSKTELILVYDSLSLLAYGLIKPLLGKHKIWYHNHDVSELKDIRKYSISWLAAKNERKAFNYLDIFSLPANERLSCFPMAAFRGQYFFIPNYPSKNFYSQFYREKKLDSPLRIIFQGSLGPYHGIEEIIPLLAETIHAFRLELILKGPCKRAFKEFCLQLAANHQVSEQLKFLPVTAYAEVPEASANCHIGIGILAKQDLMNSTLGTASNKLYEYAAVGLPVIYYDSVNFTRHLGKYSWAIPSIVTSSDIKQKIELIIEHYTELSLAAHSDFMRALNFETGFSSVKEYIITNGKLN